MSAIHQVLLAGGAAAYQVPYSLRFRYSNNASLSRTGVVTPTNDKVFTWSGWVKLGLAVTNNADYGVLFSGYTANSDAGYGVITISNPIAGFPALRIGGWATNYRITSAAFRDPSAWYHIVVAIDTTQATAGDRIKIYVNGTQVTSFGTSNNPTLNQTMGMNNASTAQRLGLDAPASSAYHFDGYMAEVNFIDGQALTPSSFGQTDSATGVWVPKKYAGTYGTNGFYLKFADASAATAAAIGKDSSGNSNNWTPSGISVTSGVTFDQMTDTPTINFSTLNPLASHTSVGTFAAANMQWSYGGGAYYPIIVGSAAINSKAYWEVTVTSVGGAAYIGIILTTQQVKGTEGTNNTLSSAGCWSYDNTGKKNNNNAPGSGTAYGASYTTGDVIGVTYDPSTTTLTFYKNNSSQGSAYTTVTAGDLYAFASGISGADFAFNFGQRPFVYTPPTGFKALNTTNLPTPAIKKGSLYMDATLRTGTGATASVSSLGFQPDLVWIKSRSAATDHGIYDAVRGVQKQLESNTTTAETTETTGLTAFNSNGYTVGALAQLNTSAATYVDWAWRETLTAGFDIMTYTGNGVSGRTVSHSLGVTPAMIVVKNRSTAGAFWSVAHKSLTSGYNLLLNDTGAQFLPGNAAYGGISTFSSSTFTVVTGLTDQRNVNTNGESYVAYLWSEIEGFSKFGSYTGNGSTDGPFVWCGAKVRWLMVKRSDTSGSWVVIDAARAPFNEANARVFAELPDAEVATTAVGFDFLASGFKARQTNANINASGGTYIFAAFAENPFKYARAR